MRKPLLAAPVAAMLTFAATLSLIIQIVALKSSRLSRYRQDELDQMRALQVGGSGYSREAEEQKARLASLKLFGEDGGCPLCEQPAPDAVPSIDRLRAETDRTARQLERVSRRTPALGELILEQEAAMADTRRRLASICEALDALGRADERLADLRDAASRRAHVLGRISLFLETLPKSIGYV